MTTHENNHTQNTPEPVPANGVPVPVGPPIPVGMGVSATPVKKREYSHAERMLLPVSLGLAMLFVWLWTSQYNIAGGSAFFLAIFWLCFIPVFYALNWQRLKKRPMLWMVSGLSAALCVWNFIYDYRCAYGGITMLVIPGVLMAHAVVVQGNYQLHQVGEIVQNWLLGWFVKPFSAIPHCFGAAGSAMDGKRGGTLKKVLLALCILMPLLMVILPLLCGADMVFGYMLERLIMDLDLFVLTIRLCLSAVLGMLLFSFLWNIRFGACPKALSPTTVRLDALIGGLVLGGLLVIYLLFCVVQFTYLFAGAGLPAGMTYSEYAREGFWQLIVVAGINLAIFGGLLQYGQKSRTLYPMLAVLLAETGVMLVSGAVRLKLYIDSYGLTWLRLLSGWFIVYLAVVLALCGVRMTQARLPLVGVCALVLLGWYTALGYMNPNRLIVQYNMAAAESSTAWVMDNADYIVSLSDDALVAVLQTGDAQALAELQKQHRWSGWWLNNGRSYASHQARVLLEQMRSTPNS